MHAPQAPHAYHADARVRPYNAAIPQQHPALPPTRRSHRRRRGATFMLILAFANLVGLVFFLIPNLYVLMDECSWYSKLVVWSAFVQWSCWNLVGSFV